MGRPGDVDRLREVLELLRNQGLNARRVRVGGIELELLPPAPPVATTSNELEPEEAQLTPEEQEREARELYEGTMYGASEGKDMPS